MLTTLVHSMRAEEPSIAVKAAATTALLNSLDFCKANFDTEAERHVIMQVVCEATQSPDKRVQETALQCLVKIMSLYYKYMEHYMRSALFGVRQVNVACGSKSYRGFYIYIYNIVLMIPKRYE